VEKISGLLSLAVDRYSCTLPMPIKKIINSVNYANYFDNTTTITEPGAVVIGLALIRLILGISNVSVDKGHYCINT